MYDVRKRMALGLALGGALLAVSGSLGAVEPAEPRRVHLEEVDVASRQLQADGVTYALSSTVKVEWLGASGRFGIGDLGPGMRVLLDLSAPDAELPVVSRIVILPD